MRVMREGRGGGYVIGVRVGLIINFFFFFFFLNVLRVKT